MTTDVFTTQRLVLKGGRSVEVTAQPTTCNRLVITPAVHTRDDTGELTLVGDKLGLTHTLTGLVVHYHSRPGKLMELATQLAELHWEFDDPQYLDSNPEVKDAAVKVIREFVMSDAYDGPVHYSGEPDEMRVARADDPSGTLLREHLDDWLAYSKAHYEQKDFDKNREAYMARIVASCNGYGLLYLLAVVRAIDPKVADVAARDLVMQFDAGDSLGEWVYQWREELAAGKPLTLRGVPNHETLHNFGSKRAGLKPVTFYQAQCTGCGHVEDEYGDFSAVDDPIEYVRDIGEWFERTRSEPAPRPDCPQAVIMHTVELLCPDCQKCEVCGADRAYPSPSDGGEHMVCSEHEDHDFE